MCFSGASCLTSRSWRILIIPQYGQLIWWAWWSFVGVWWKLYADDPYWSPPDYAAWHRLVVRMDAPYWQRIDAQPVYMEALPQRRLICGALVA